MTAMVLLGISLLLVARLRGLRRRGVRVRHRRPRPGRAAPRPRATPGARACRRRCASLSTQLSGAQVGITVTNLAIGFLAEPAIAELIDGPLEAARRARGRGRARSRSAIGLTLGTVLTMIFGELVPKNLAIARPMETARATQGFMRGFTAVMHVADPAAQRLGQRARTPRSASSRRRSCARRAAPTELASLVAALRRPGHARRRDRRADGAVGRVRHPHRRRDHDAAGAAPSASRRATGPPRSSSWPAQTGHSRFPVLDEERQRRRHGARQARGGAAGARAGHHPGQAHHGQADRGARLAAARPAAGAAARRTASRWPSSSTSTAATPASSPSRTSSRRSSATSPTSTTGSGAQARQRRDGSWIALRPAAARRGRGRHRRRAARARGLRHRRRAGAAACSAGCPPSGDVAEVAGARPHATPRSRASSWPRSTVTHMDGLRVDRLALRLLDRVSDGVR